MGHGASAGWIAGVALCGALSVLACGGHSENSGGDGSSDDSFGGSSGSASGGASSGGTSQGGSATGGISQGGSIAVGGTGSGAGGTISIGGTSTGTGGATSCTDCYDTEYGLIIKGDGPAYEMSYNGWLDASAADRITLPCPESPLRGTVGGCSRSISLSACEDPMSGPPCLEIGGAAVRYVSHQTGELFTGWVTNDAPTTSIPGVESGILTIELTNAAGEALVLTVSYAFCAPPLSNLRIVC